jgi:citrate lyase beta subunit
MSFNKGYRYKFILHPAQLRYLKQIDYFTEDEINFAQKVASTIDINSSFGAIELDGQILEKPHILRIKEILRSIENGT